eukprot:TRINITY_DN1018_c0_g1_i2.p2 TRINITY_DN1018_c0_g1~~TRINITY_DN1018_c0_g1_i2.p2  ORF type:complete len:472 (-),score=65.08 TRINITY_DN1018_c0_g1_i2:1693-3108(-)
MYTPQLDVGSGLGVASTHTGAALSPSFFSSGELELGRITGPATRFSIPDSLPLADELVHPPRKPGERSIEDTAFVPFRLSSTPQRPQQSTRSNFVCLQQSDLNGSSTPTKPWPSMLLEEDDEDWELASDEHEDSNARLCSALQTLALDQWLVENEKTQSRTFLGLVLAKSSHKRKERKSSSSTTLLTPPTVASVSGTKRKLKSSKIPTAKTTTKAKKAKTSKPAALDKDAADGNLSSKTKTKTKKKAIPSKRRAKTPKLSEIEILAALDTSKLSFLDRMRVERIRCLPVDTYYAPRFSCGPNLLDKASELKVSLVVNLYANGFSLSGSADQSAIPYPYDHSTKEFLRTLDSQRLAPDFVELLEGVPCQYYDGCIVVEIRDYRTGPGLIANAAGSCVIRRILLRPDTETVINDVEQICAEHEDPWIAEECLNVEQHVLVPLLLLLLPTPTAYYLLLYYLISSFNMHTLLLFS